MKLNKAIILTALAIILASPAVTHAGISVIGTLTHQKITTQSQNYTGTITLKNTSNEPQEVKLYQTDYKFNCDGSSKYGQPGMLPRSNANWITFSPQRLVVAPNDVTTVNYSVDVPADPNLIGTYWSMIMVEAISKNSRESSIHEKGKTKLGISQVVRYGIQMITQIGQTGQKQIDFINTELTGEDKKTLRVDVENTGQQWLRPTLWIELYDINGNHIGKFDGPRKRTFPGTSVKYIIDMAKVPAGSYKALVVADAGGDDIFGANYTLEFK